MEVLDIRPHHGGGSTIALFDVQLTPEVRMFGLRLVKVARGYRVYSPSAHGCNVATFAPEFAEKLSRAALAALAGENDDSRAA
ncbi:hypothetical protein [Sinorhizobium medicae]